MLLLSISELRQEADLNSHMTSYVFACIAVAYIVVFTFFVPSHYLVVKDQKEPEDWSLQVNPPKWKNKSFFKPAFCSCLYDGIKTQNMFQALYYTWFVVRRIFLVWLLLFAHELSFSI